MLTEPHVLGNSVASLCFIFCLIVVPGPPSAPGSTSVVNTTANTAFLSWVKPNILGGRNDTFYNVFLIIGAELTKVNTDPINTTSYTITGLSPATTYLCLVFAENGVSFNEEGSVRRAAQVTFGTRPDGNEHL